MNVDGPQPDVQAVLLEHEAPRCWLRRSVPGEYLAMGLMFHSAFGAVAWVIAAWQAPVAMSLVAAGAWIAGRAAGAFSGRWFTPVLTAGLAMAVVAVWHRGLALPYSALAIFSPAVFAAMLAVILAADLIELSMTSNLCDFAIRWRRLHWHRLAIYAFVVLFVIYMVLVPTAGWIIERMQPPNSSRVLEDMTLAEQVRLRSMEAMAALWFFALGGTIGSFLNVLAYRMPRGESVVLQRSHCPRCGTQILGRDNVPIFGWLLLGGKCRACQAPISVRYPAVEAMTAALFLWLYFVELISGGANIPVRQPNSYHGVVWIIFYTKWDLIRLYLYHSFVLSALITCVLLDVDGQRATTRAKCCAALTLFVPPLIWPDLLPVPVVGNASEWLPMAWLCTGFSCLVGGLVGAVLGRLTAWGIEGAASPARMTSTRPVQLTGGLAIVGMALGWQAAIAVMLFALLLRLTCAAVASWRRCFTSLTAALLAAFVLHHTVWRWTFEYGSPWWPSTRTSTSGWVALGTAYIALLLANRRIGCLSIAQTLEARQIEDIQSIGDCDATSITKVG